MPTNFPPDEEIQAFWSWFVSIADLLAKDLTNKDLLRTLDSRISAFGPISWEVGPGTERKLSLVISPDGDLSLLPLTRRIVSLAPAVPDWDLHPAKPPKRWNLIFNIHSGTDRKIDVDARTWKYVLYEFPDGTFDVTIIAPNLALVDEGNRIVAAEIVLDGVLGEERRLECIEGIDVQLTVPDTALDAKSSNIQALGDHIKSLRANQRS